MKRDHPGLDISTRFALEMLPIWPHSSYAYYRAPTGARPGIREVLYGSPGLFNYSSETADLLTRSDR